VEVSASVIVRDRKRTLVGVAHDVTERARMQALLEERVATLSRIAADVVLDLPMAQTLNALSTSAVRASTAVACLIFLLDDEEVHLAGARGVPEGYEIDGATSTNREAIRTHSPVLFRNASRSFYPQRPWDSVFVVPLLSRGKALGAIDFAYPHGQEPGEEKVFLGAVADQAAVENARLFSDARGKAVLEKRQKLAGELLPGSPEDAAGPLEYAVEEGLVAALEKQAAVQARHGIRVETSFGEEPKESLYRIAQEALHNTVKHARATNVQIELAREFEGITLKICDDGAGFDTQGHIPGHLGLKSMRERPGKAERSRSPADQGREPKSSPESPPDDRAEIEPRYCARRLVVADQPQGVLTISAYQADSAGCPVRLSAACALWCKRSAHFGPPPEAYAEFGNVWINEYRRNNSLSAE
jgi:hypothetical protein